MFSKKIEDIIIYKNQIICIRKLEINSKDLENQIQILNYSGNNLLKDAKVENSLLPPFVLSFYHFLFSYLKIPNSEEFLDNYFNISGYIVDKKNAIYKGDSFNVNGIKARALRSYPSLIRDYHFYTLLKDRSEFSNVKYSLLNDYKDGIDLSLTYKGSKFSISLFIATARGRKFKKIKENRHDYSKVKEIILSVNFNELIKRGDIYLLKRRHIDTLIEELEVNN